MQFFTQVLELSLAAGVLGVDATAAFQVMASRPMVAGGVAGWLVGDLGTGLATGSLVELLWMGGVPVGSLVPPDGTVAAVFAAAASVLLPRWSPGLDPLAGASLGLLAAVPVGALGARTEIIQRRLCDRLSRRAEAGVAAGRKHEVIQALMGGLALAFARAFLAAALALGLGIPALALLTGHLPLEALQALHWGYWLGWLLGLAVAADYFWERRSLKYLGIMMLGVAVVGSRPGVSQVQLLALALGVALLGGLWRWRRAWIESQEDQA
jgi:mannose/fructose/N-acetylgalactosamine-specific phosphotransferase system component IIC